MNKRTYSFGVGVVMVIASFLFFLLPVLFSNIDAFIPVMLAMLSLLIGIAFFFMGFSEK
jgi:hypothetical protein